MKDPFTVCSHIAICRLLVRVCVHTLIIAYCFGNRYTHALHRVLYCILPSAPLCFVLGSSLRTQSPGDIRREGLHNLFGLVVFKTRTANLMWDSSEQTNTGDVSKPKGGILTAVLNITPVFKSPVVLF